MEEYKIYGYIIEQRMLWYRYRMSGVEYTQQVTDLSWSKHYNKKVYDTLESAEEALKQINNSYPDIANQWERRIKPLYENTKSN